MTDRMDLHPGMRAAYEMGCAAEARKVDDMIVHLLDVPDDPVGIAPRAARTCLFCGRQYKTNDGMQRHLAERHGDLL